MSKTLILLRHGKSNWSSPYGHDHERPLAPRGEKAADLMGRLLAKSGQFPDRVVSSTAVRARTTAERVMAAAGWNGPFETTQALYETDAASVLLEVNQLAESARSVLLVGHNFSWRDLASDLIGGGQLRFPTAIMARIDLEVELWAEVDWGCGELIWMLQPKFFPNEPKQ